MFDNVLVGVDDGEGGRDAIALARMLAAQGSKLTLAQVYQGDSEVSRAPARPTRPPSTSGYASCSRRSARRPECRGSSDRMDRRRWDAGSTSSLS